MKKKYRRVRPIFTYTLGAFGIIAFTYGLLAHGSTIGTVSQVLGFGAVMLSVLTVEKFEVKA